MNLKIDVVIPTYIGDFDCIIPCISNILLQTIPPNNIIVAVSEINVSQKIFLQNETEKINNTSINIIILDTPNKNYCAQNRNRGIEYCKINTQPNYIMLVDCDDITHTKKIEYFLNFLKIRPSMNMFLHEYVFRHEKFDIYNNYNTKENDILLCYYSDGSNVLSTNPDTKIHHGHPIVKSEIAYELKYNENMKCYDDTEFCIRVYKKYGEVYNYTNPLLKYLN